MKKHVIDFNYNNHKIIGDIIPADSIPQVLCLHGGGFSSRERYELIRNLLAENNISSVALDFLGHGETVGDFKDSSLKSRTEQVKLLIEMTGIISPFVIIAGSMGGYDAIKLTEIYPVKLLVLLAPAVYDKAAYEVPFGSAFSFIIRTPGSWDHTDAWEILKKYKGKLLVLSAGQDKIIPEGVVQKIYDSASGVSYKEMIVYPDSEHSLLKNYLNEHPEELKKVVDKIVEIIK